MRSMRSRRRQAPRRSSTSAATWGCRLCTSWRCIRELGSWSSSPNPALFARRRRNVGGFGAVTIAPVEVTDREGAARLHVPAGSWSGRLSDGGGYPISSITLDSLLAKHHFLAVDVLKFAIEGAEFGALRVADLFQ